MPDMTPEQIAKHGGFKTIIYRDSDEGQEWCAACVVAIKLPIKTAGTYDVLFPEEGPIHVSCWGCGKHLATHPLF